MSQPTIAKILIVDDEIAQMRALCATLGEQGYETHGFSSGAEALAAMAQAKFDLLLSDLMMPGMDGIALLQAALKIDSDLVGVIMTGQGTISTAVDAMKSGALDYILKPFKLSAILPVIERALTMRRLRLENIALERQVREHATELEIANRELEAFSYSISHDLRAPLRAVTMMAQMVCEDCAGQIPPESFHNLGRVVAGAERMNQLIEDLLRFSRCSRQPLELRPLDLNLLVNSALKDLAEENAAREVELRLTTLPERKGDVALLRQVFVNLLGNAYKFTGQRKPAVIEVGVNGTGADAVFFVRDNGAGFSMKYVDRLFGVFQRLHDQTEFKGTGIGLSIVQRIIQRHGGRIWAEGEEGKGAAFFFTLPT